MVHNAALSLLVFGASFSIANAFSGDGTHFTPGQGACDSISSSDDIIVAIDTSLYANGEHCFKHIGISYNGKFVDATVVDECPDCSPGSIDLSPAAFKRLAPLSEGRLHGVQWSFE